MQNLANEYKVKFNTPVGDKDDNGNYIDRQFTYYPEHQMMATDGGTGIEDAMPQESLEMGEGILINAESEHELLQWYWKQTAEQRAHHDAVYAQEKEPPLTIDGNPEGSDTQNGMPEPELDASHFGRESGNGNGMPSMQAEQRKPTQEPQQEFAAPTVEVEVAALSEMQRQLIVAEYQPLLDLQGMVIQTQAIILRNVLDPASPHHEIIEAWLSQLEALRGKIDE